MRTRTISVEEQAAQLAERGRKPVEPLDETRMQCADGYVVRVLPNDACDRIAYRYETVFYTQKVRRDIQALKDQFTDSDYKVIKCYEAALIGGKMPYDVAAILSQ